MLIQFYNKSFLPAIAKILPFVLVLAASGCFGPREPADIALIRNGDQISALLRANRTDRVLVDPGAEAHAGRMKDFLKERGVSVLSHVLITDDDPERYGALKTIAASFPVKQIYYPKSRVIKPEFAEVLKQMEHGGTKVKALAIQQYVTFKEGEIVILAPDLRSADTEDRFAFKWIYGKTSVFFLPRISTQVQEEILQYYMAGVEAPILILPDGKLSAKIGERIKARYLVTLQAGQVAEAGAAAEPVVLDENGRVVFQTDGKAVVRIT